MTELESDYISDYYMVLNSYVLINVDPTSSFRCIIKIRPFKIKSKYWNLFSILGEDWSVPDNLFNN